jgi:ABC-type bacteriocin/lantibiotic exporter with double-glycine peptidase domain
LNFNEVVFKYPTSENLIFNKLNISIIPKKMTLIIGDSGSGKNTLIKLLIKIYQPTTGEINFGKYNYKKLSEKTIRKNITIISNTFPLFGKTVYEAISYSRSPKKEHKASKLLKDLQQFEDDNNKLELHDSIGDLGHTLTKGQKKILLYCRALLTNKAWLIIDQPFKDLNPKTTTYLKSILNSLKNTKTLIIIDSHILEGLNTDYTFTLKNKTLVKN